MRQPDPATPDGAASEGETLARFAVLLAAQRGQIAGLSDKVDQLAADVTALTAASPKGPPMIAWHDLDPDEAAAVRADLAKWVDGTLFRIYPSARDSIRDCWQAHPDAVTELSAAWLEFRRIFTPAPPAAHGKPGPPPRRAPLADTLTFLDRWLPGALRRVKQVTEKCTGIDGHTARPG